MVSDQPRAMGRAPRSAATDEMLTTAIVAELPRLRRHALYLSYNHADADDLVQDCLEAALSKKASLQDPAKPAQLAVLDSQQFLSHAAAFRSPARANVADRGF